MADRKKVFTNFINFLETQMLTKQEEELFEAIKYDDRKTFNELITTDVDLNATDNESWAPVHWAVFYGRLTYVQELIKKRGEFKH